MSGSTIELAHGEEDTGDRYGLAEIPDLQSPVVEEDDQGKKKTIVLKENKVAIAFILIPMAILGTLIRVGLQRLHSYAGAPVFGLIAAQWVGCFIMGMVVQQKDALIQWHEKVTRYLPLQIGLSTGLCGSITTFSSWMLDMFKAFANYDAYPHNTGYNVLAAIWQFLVTLGMSLNGLTFGYHVGRLISHVPIQLFEFTEIVPHGFSVRHLGRYDAAVMAFGTASWLAVVFAAIFTHHQRELMLACVFAPLGALLRWHLSVFNAKVWKGKFFCGTFLANMLGTMVLAVLALLQSGVVMSSIACDVVQAFADGFCGCLTTISTFVVELSNLPLRHTYVYGISSVVLGQCFMFLICGTFIWTQGVHPSCSA
ncbi:CrcB-like protein-domain-containing protein [Fennellomyces sp. T-0311]|nr:CrcB-like protein-domain-containing protein [Fennellomyces sp. T-0311]